MRIKQKDLEDLVGIINIIKGFDNPKYSEVGSYVLAYAYGGVQLQKYTNTSGGVNTITSGFVPKKELYYQIRAFIEGLTS